MNRLLDKLRAYKVVLFGVGAKGRTMLGHLVSNGIHPAYFVDDNPDIKIVECTQTGTAFSVFSPKILLDEDKSKLKIIISADYAQYDETRLHIKKLGLGECLFSTHILCCDRLLHGLVFHADHITFCSGGARRFKAAYPRLPYLDTAKQTIENVIKARIKIIDELSDNSKIERSYAKACENCAALRTMSIFSDDKISGMDLGHLPYICQARCIYCSYNHSGLIRKHKTQREMQYPEMITEMIRYLQENDLIAKDCHILATSGEITVMPDKDRYLDAISEYNVQFDTNAFLFDTKIADALSSTKSHIYMSLDSGTGKMFQIIKGHDLFERVIDNLKRYREHGEVRLKYIIIPGVNNGDGDINGFIGILKALDLNSFYLSFDFGLPLRAGFYSIVKFVRKIKENELSCVFRFEYKLDEIDGLIAEYFEPDIQRLKSRDEHLRSVFHDKYLNDYKAYRKYIFCIEIRDLIIYFKQGTRFALLGETKKESNIVSAFKDMDILLQAPDMPYEKSYDMVKDSADIFIIRNRSKFVKIKDYVTSKGGNADCLLDIERYYFSFEPAKLFAKRYISEEFLNPDA